MSQEPEHGFVPRAPRFKVADTSALKVSIKRTEEEEQVALEAELLDVSQHGTKLRVPVNLRFEEALQLKIEVADTDIEYHGIASVRHIRAVDEGHWVVGCAVAPPLSDETFSFLATTAGKERRRFRRLNIAAEATVRRQAQTEGVAAALHNLSSGGLCFSSSDQYEVGERVQLSLEDNDGEQRVIEAQICWQVESPDGSIAGCQFTTKESYADLCACLTEQPVLARHNRNQEAPTSKLVLTAAVLAMFVPPMMTLMMQANKVSANGVAAPATNLVQQQASEDDCIAKAVPAAPDEQPVLTEFVDTGLESTDQELAEETTEPIDTEEASIAPEPSLEQAQVREWVDNTGKFRTMAQLVEVADEHVVLLKTDGKQSTVPWDRLSEADQEFARSWQDSNE